MESESWLPSATRLRIASTALLALMGGWVLYTFPPSSSRFYPRCAFHALTGLDCPGCGSTRALHELLHGHVGAAFRLNPLLFALMIAGAFAMPSLMRGETPPFVMTRWFGWGSVIVVLGWWVVRNL
jgi:hypothetical protein